MTIMTKSTFKSDLDWGNHWEWESISFITENFNKVLNTRELRLRFMKMNEGKKIAEMKGWDSEYQIVDTLTCQVKKTLRFEIKADKYDSNNLFFERSCNGKQGGVYATTADYFVYILPKYRNQNFYIIKPQDLMKLLDAKYATHLQTGGDGGRVFGYLIEKESFTQDFINAGGKMLDWTIEIPHKFNVEKFQNKSKVVYQADKMKKYPDLF